MAKYLITLTKTEELLLTVPADSAPKAEALAPDEVRGLDWNNAKILDTKYTKCYNTHTL